MTCRTIQLLPEGNAGSAGDSSLPAPCLAAISNSENLHNPGSIQPVSLPLEVKAFTKLPVVVSAKSSGVAKPLVAFAMLFLSGEVKSVASNILPMPRGAAGTEAEKGPEKDSSSAAENTVEASAECSSESGAGCKDDAKEAALVP